ncbi:MAG: hypothetical protein ACKVQB_05680 [Bacteroidia bacterium]
MYFSVNNGEINTKIPFCKLGNYGVKGFDYTTFLTTNIFEGTLSEPISNFGVLAACDSFGEYISYSVDGKPAKIITSLIECYDKSGGFEISAKYGLDYFQLSSSKKTNGKYGLLDINFSAADIHYAPGGLNIIFNLQYGKSKGDFVDIEISGSFMDFVDLSTHTVKGIVHVKRDN